MSLLALIAVAMVSPPNLVLLFCDDAGYGDFGFSGHPTIRTPNLDRMAREGTRPTQFYSASPACTASRYSVLTGKYPGVPAVDGADVWGLVRSGVPLPKRPFFYSGLSNEVFAVRGGRWKLHRKTYSQLGIKHFEDPMPLLFDFEADPSEVHNVASAHPTMVARLQGLLTAFDERLRADGTFWDR